MQEPSDVPSFPKSMLLAAASASALAAAFLPASLTGPPPAHTGGFNEPTCHSCHFDFAPNEAGATSRLDSLPEMYEPERAYRLQLRLQHRELKRGGFQLSARYEDGTQAGRFTISDTTLLRVQRSNDVDYLSHKFAGTDQVSGDTAIWNFVWVAPVAMKRVVFNVAYNVADKDASQFGDRTFTAVFYSGGEPVRK